MLCGRRVASRCGDLQLCKVHRCWCSGELLVGVRAMTLPVTLVIYDFCSTSRLIPPGRVPPLHYHFVFATNCIHTFATLAVSLARLGQRIGNIALSSMVMWK